MKHTTGHLLRRYPLALVWLLIYRHLLQIFCIKDIHRFLILCFMQNGDDIAQGIFFLSCLVDLDSVYSNINVLYFSPKLQANIYGCRHHVFQHILHHRFCLKLFCYRASLLYVRMAIIPFAIPLSTSRITATQAFCFTMKSIDDFSFCLKTPAVMPYLYTVDYPGSKSRCISSQA